MDWIDLKTPGNSRFLTAPLAKEAGGLGKCTGENVPAVYANGTDADYKAVLDLLAPAVKKAWDWRRIEERPAGAPSLMAAKRKPNSPNPRRRP